MLIKLFKKFFSRKKSAPCQAPSCCGKSNSLSKRERELEILKEELRLLQEYMNKNNMNM